MVKVTWMYFDNLLFNLTMQASMICIFFLIQAAHRSNLRYSYRDRYLSKSELAKHPVEPFFEPLLKDFFRGIACYCVVVLVDQGIEVGCSSFIVQGALQLPQLRLNFCVKSRSHKVIVLI